MDNLQRANQTELVVNTNISDGPPLSIVESSGQTLALTTVSVLSLPDLGEGGPVMVDISNFTAARILDERASPSGVEYRCELEPLWLAADLVEKAKMGRVHIRNYKNGPTNQVICPFLFLRLNSPQASSRGSQPIWDEGARDRATTGVPRRTC